ncbi:hypothetical protein VHEMI08586 [[Torrubiella] hemipterigena]|uniref:Stress-response A/B barrel domain-containing protein n=1 Tax=[Torrubiella] hemipterigena TaxID=1531966 RepID=A0A0A1TDX4_9HYPO|nr:hypothetical protein VHEMI08586 [[Torrubiella] hemipterigena]
MAPVIHIVMFQFKEDVSTETIKEMSDRMLGLKTNCIHATTKQPYILSSRGGTDMSIEGLTQGYTHAYVVEFASKEDRDYYVKEDPVHAAYVKDVVPLLIKPCIFDYHPGEFTHTKL